MIKDTFSYLYLIVPNEYRCVYYNILDTLGTLGEDLLSSCTATCKGRAISGFACYNMFIAACACYYLGQIKRARVLINYIKAQLEIDCNKVIVFEDSTNDEWVVLKVPTAYQCIFEKLLNKLSSWGQELLDDCTVSCKGKNRNILNSWNLFQAAVTAYEYGNVTKADRIIDYIATTLGFNCSEQPSTDYYTVNVITIPSSATVTINGLSTKSISLAAGSSVSIVAKLSGYYDKTMNIGSLVKDETIEIEFTDTDKIPVTTTYNVTIGTPTPANAVIKVNGITRNTGDILTVEAGTVLVVTATANGYQPYSENVIVDKSKTIAPVLTPQPVTNYKYTVVVRVNGSVINDATVVLTNQTSGESVTSNQITVPNNTTVGVVVSKQGYNTETFNRVITENYTENVDLTADDGNVYIQINGSKDTDDLDDVNRVKVYVRNSLNGMKWIEIPNNVPYQITKGEYYYFEIIPVNNNGEPDLSNHKPKQLTYSGSKTRTLVGTTVVDVVLDKKGNSWLYIVRSAKDENDALIDNAKYLDGGDNTSFPKPSSASPLGFYYKYYGPNDNAARGVSVVANGYEGLDYDGWNPSHQDIDITPVLKRSDSHLIVVPRHTDSYGGVMPLYDNAQFDNTDPYKNDFTIYPRVVKSNVVRAYLFIDTNLDDNKANKNINDIGTTGSIPNGSSSRTPTTPISIVFNNSIARIVGTAIRDNDRWVGPHHYPIIFEVDENYQAGAEIVATIEDGVYTRHVTFIMPTIPEYEYSEIAIPPDDEPIPEDDEPEE